VSFNFKIVLTALTLTPKIKKAHHLYLRQVGLFYFAKIINPVPSLIKKEINRPVFFSVERSDLALVSCSAAAQPVDILSLLFQARNIFEDFFINRKKKLI